jgi:hypothetical protein
MVRTSFQQPPGVYNTDLEFHPRKHPCGFTRGSVAGARLIEGFVSGMSVENRKVRARSRGACFDQGIISSSASLTPEKPSVIASRISSTEQPLVNK